MNITRIAIEKSRITWVAIVVVVAAGINTYFNMPRAEDPGFVVRQAVVLTYFPGGRPSN